MALQAFQSILGLVIKEARKQSTAGQELNGAVASSDIDFNSANMQEILNGITQMLTKMFRPTIVQGLQVTATNPPTMYVNVAPGYGGAAGKLHEYAGGSIQIPNSRGMWYLIIDGSTLKIATSGNVGLPIAKIVIPQPGVTAQILDDQNLDSSYDGYIIDGRDLTFDNSFVIDDETIPVLKNAMSRIFAEYIFGEIKLSEALKITNTQGTMEADSASIRFLNVDGEELAFYGALGARVGNIKVTPNSIESRNFTAGKHGFQLKDDGNAEFDNIVARGTVSSPNFTSGPSGNGWKIDQAGDATFNNGYFRGELHTSVFVKDTINATNGNLIVTNATVLASNVATGDTTIAVKDAVFAVGDIIRLHPDVDRNEFMSITGVSGNTYTVTRDLQGSGVKTFETGDAVVSWMSHIELVASGDTAASMPYIDIIQRNSTSSWSDYSTKARLGNLAGITDAQFGTLNGYGLYTNNGYFTGSLKASNISGGTISGTTISGGSIIGQHISASTISGTTMSGNTINGQDILAGSITASQITAGTFTTAQLLANGDFEDWNAGTTVAPDGWAVTGAGALVERIGNATYVKLGSYSCGLQRNGNNCYIYQDFSAEKGTEYWKGITVTFSCWVWADTAGAVRIGISANTFSAYHSGGSNWEYLTVTKTLDTTTPLPEANCLVLGSNTEAFFDGAMLVEGSYAMAYAPSYKNTVRKLVVSPPAFVLGSSSGAQPYEISEKYLYVNSDTGGDTFYAPINLPNKVIITNLRVYYRDTASSGSILRLYKTTTAGVSSVLAGVAMHEGGDTYGEDAETHIVDNDTYSYALSLDLEDGGLMGAIYHAFYSAVITYTAPSPLP